MNNVADTKGADINSSPSLECKDSSRNVSPPQNYSHDSHDSRLICDKSVVPLPADL